jgi:hypothetical protein
MWYGFCILTFKHCNQDPKIQFSVFIINALNSLDMKAIIHNNRRNSEPGNRQRIFVAFTFLFVLGIISGFNVNAQRHGGGHGGHGGGNGGFSSGRSSGHGGFSSSHSSSGGFSGGQSFSRRGGGSFSGGHSAGQGGGGGFSNSHGSNRGGGFSEGHSGGHVSQGFSHGGGFSENHGFHEPGIVRGPRHNEYFGGYARPHPRYFFGDRYYHYGGGRFFHPYRERYWFGIYPLGFRLHILPRGFMSFYIGGFPYYYYGGSYFVYRNDQYEVIAPPEGALVESLPRNYQTVEIEGETYYIANGIQYRPVLRDGQIWYQVIKSPNNQQTIDPAQSQNPVEDPTPAPNSY